MSVSYRNNTTGLLERAAGYSDTDAVLSPISRNPIQNKAVYDALAQKIEKTVADLENYYNTSQTYNKQEVRELIGSINTLTIEVVATLPTEDISSTTIYFVGPKAGTSTYDEYVYVNNAWVQIGDTEIDLSNYVTSADLTTALQSYYTKTQTDNLFNDYYDKDNVDDLLDLKQDVLTFDNSPTSGSANPVTSNGIRTAINNAIVSSAGGSIIKVHHVDGAVVVGDTVTASKGDYSASATFDNSGDAIIIGFGEIGDRITITATNGTDVGISYIDIPCFSNYSMTISYGVDYKSWLTAGGLTPSLYDSLDEVLADEEAVRKLMTIHSSVDYLVDSIMDAADEDALVIFNNDYCAKWISLRDYAIDTLSTNAYIVQIMSDVGKYGYGEVAFVPQVPTMTSATAPYGQVIYGTQQTNYYAYMAFDGTFPSITDSGNVWYSNQSVNDYVGYKFLTPTVISYVRFRTRKVNGTAFACKDYIIQGSNTANANDWHDLKSGTYPSTSSGFISEKLTNTDAYLYYRLFVENTYNGLNICIQELQFYTCEPQGNVPIMTNNTAPYGEAISSSDSGSYYAYKAFNRTASDGNDIWAASANTGWIGYKFTAPVCVRKFSFTTRNNTARRTPSVFTLEGSYDASNWTVIQSYTNSENEIVQTLTFDTTNENYYLAYRINVTDTITTAATTTLCLSKLQFYGREMKVSIPNMTNYTIPYGSVTGSSERTDTDQELWKAFNHTDSDIGSTTVLNNGYFAYEFAGDVVAQEAYLLGNSGSSGYWNVSPKTVKFQYSLDNGLTWEDASDELSYGGNSMSAIVPTMYSINEDKAKAKLWRVLTIDNWGASVCTSLKDFNLYGFDYSEYEWDTAYPRHYLFDHGVELDDVTFYATSVVCENDGNCIYLYNAANNKAIAYMNINLTNYNLIRAVAGDTLASCFVATANNKPEPEGASDWTLYSYTTYPISSVILPYNMYLDCSAISTSKYIGVGRASSGAFKNKIVEWWLE